MNGTNLGHTSPQDLFVVCFGDPLARVVRFQGQPNLLNYPFLSVQLLQKLQKKAKLTKVNKKPERSTEITFSLTCSSTAELGTSSRTSPPVDVTAGLTGLGPVAV